MELPDDVISLIKEYSMPITSPKWRNGCYFKQQLKYNTNYHNYILYLVMISFRFTPNQLSIFVNHNND